MQPEKNAELIRMAWEIHGVVEAAYLAHPATRHGDSGSAEWLEKQRLLLADMAIHLLQTAIQPGAIPLDRLKDNLHAVLTIADQFLPAAQLKQATDKIYTGR